MKTAAIVAGLHTLSCVSAYTANRPSVLQTGDVCKPSTLYVIIFVSRQSLHRFLTSPQMQAVWECRSMIRTERTNLLRTYVVRLRRTTSTFCTTVCHRRTRVDSILDLNGLLQVFSCGNLFCFPAQSFDGKGDNTEIGRISGNYWNSRAQRAGG
jgi:hypothetical protein